MARFRLLIPLLICLFFYSDSLSAVPRVYTFMKNLTLRTTPDTHETLGQSAQLFTPGEWATVLHDQGEWKKVRLDNGSIGYVNKAYVTDLWIKVWKQERLLFLMKNEKILKHFPIALSSKPKINKKKRGDYATPTGRFFISDMLLHPEFKKNYGKKSLLLSYPHKRDARYGLQKRWLSKQLYIELIKEIEEGGIPLQHTLLGGDIRIQGGGIGTDWTKGSIALRDQDIKTLYDAIQGKQRIVEIYYDMQTDQEMNQTDYMNKRILKSTKLLMESGCIYTKSAKKIIKIDFPLGDFDPKKGISEDLIIRALRKTGIDLQALIYEDIIFHPERYPEAITPNPHMDHRRGANIKTFLDQHAIVLACRDSEREPAIWKAGDIVIFDTGKGVKSPDYRLGIVSDTKINQRPLVITLWNEGYTIGEMDLLKETEAVCVGHYRMKPEWHY